MSDVKDKKPLHNIDESLSITDSNTDSARGNHLNEDELKLYKKMLDDSRKHIQQTKGVIHKKVTDFKN